MVNGALNSPSAAEDDLDHLMRLRSLVERVIADGKISAEESDELRAALMADGQITADELDLVRLVLRARLGDTPLQFE